MADRLDESGAVTAFVACFTVALIAVFGLVVDGGLVLASRRQAFDSANAAARVGAQAVDVGVLRAGGPVVLMPEEARRRAEGRLALDGLTGTVDVAGDTITVHTSATRELSVLGFVGLGSITVQATGTAHAAEGVRQEGD